MRTRYRSAQLFFYLAIGSAILGAAIFRGGLPSSIYLYPVALLTSPRLVPFAIALISASIGAIYVGAEKDAGRKTSVAVATVQMAFLLLGAWGYVVLLRFWSSALSNEPGASHHIPVLASTVFVCGFGFSLLAFFINIFGKSTRAGAQ